MHPDSGGTSQGIRNIIPELEKLGVHNEVVCLDDPSENFIAGDAFTIVALGPAKGPWRYSSKLIPWLVDNMGEFDIVVVNALWLYHGYAFLKALRQYKGKAGQLKLPRFFVMPHGMLDPYFQKAGERKIKALRNWVYWKLIEHKLVNNAEGLLFTCKAELLLAREPFRPYHPKKELNIGYGAQAPPPFDSLMSKAFIEKCPEVKDKPFILFLSRIHDKKGVDLLLNAYEHVANKMTTAKGNAKEKTILPKLVIAGPGLDSVYGKKMLQLVAESAILQEAVVFPGMLTGNAKWGAFYNTGAFILPSHQENFGIAVVEALACGIPVLISNQVNIWSEIAEAGGGLVEDDTTEGTEKLLEAWYNLPTEEKKVMGEKAKRSFTNNFSIAQAARRFYETVID
jgi:glycosyltransferase involved in cell wall biosynthesis